MSDSITPRLKRTASIGHRNEAIEVEVKDLGYTVIDGITKQKKILLQNITGKFRPGTVTAIMGSSGAGKTTLLNTLAGRVPPSNVEGEILFNAKPRDRVPGINKRLAYVMQDDIMMATQTCNEIIRFSARMRLPSTMTDDAVYKRAADVIEELNLNKVTDTQVGAPGVVRGVSGGERKRVAIGVELVTNPRVMFLDEPTSGLDSTTAELVMETLRKLAQEKSRTIVLTIHQPNSHIFQLLDNLILLAKGNLVFWGAASNAVDYFSSLGFVCPSYSNPPDFFMQLLYIDTSVEGGDAKVNELVTAFHQKKPTDPLLKSATPRDLPDPVTAANTQSNAEIATETNVDLSISSGGSDEGIGLMGQSKHLFRRSVQDLTRNPLKLKAMMAQTFFFSVVLGLVYLRVGTNQGSIQDRQGLLWFAGTFVMFDSVSGVIGTFPMEKVIFFREYSTKMYGVFPYYICKLLAEVPAQVVSYTVFSVVIYFMVGLKEEPGAFFMFWVSILLLSQTGSAMGFFTGVLASDASVAFTVAPMTLLPFVLFSGFLVNYDSMPPYFVWIYWISPLHYANAALIKNEFENQVFHCDSDEFSKDGSCPVVFGEQQIDKFSYDLSSGESLIILACMMGALRVASFVFLWWKARNTVVNA